MSNDYYFGFDLERLGGVGSRFHITIDSQQIEINVGKHAHVDLSEVTSYTEFAAALEAAVVAKLSAEYSVTYDPTTYAYSFWKSGGCVVSFPNSAAGNSAALILGFTPGTAYLSANPRTSDRRPGYLLLPTIGGQASASDEYEPRSTTVDAEADDGSIYSLSTRKGPIYLDWTQPLERREAPSSLGTRGAAVFKREATALVPWSWQHAIEHARNVEPIHLRGPLSPAGVVMKLRQEAASFKPMRVTQDYDGLWNFDFKTRLVGRISPRTLKTVSSTSLNNYYGLLPGDVSAFPGAASMTVGVVLYPGSATHAGIETRPMRKFASAARGYQFYLQPPSPTYDRPSALVVNGTPANTTCVQNAPYLWSPNRFYTLVYRVSAGTPGTVSIWLNGVRVGSAVNITGYTPATSAEVLEVFRGSSATLTTYQFAALTYAEAALPDAAILGWHKRVAASNSFDFPGITTKQTFYAGDAESSPGVAAATWPGRKTYAALAREGSPTITTHIEPVFA